MRRCGSRWQAMRLAALGLAAMLPAACVAPEPTDPFAGGWTNGESQRIAFRDNTVVQQPDLRDRLARLLVRPDYPVAELGCGEGDTTYVLLGDRDLVAIYRDAGVAGIERLSRS